LNRFILLFLVFILISSPVFATTSFADSINSENFESQNSQNSIENNYKKSVVVESRTNIHMEVFDKLGTYGSTESIDKKLNQQTPIVTNSKNLHFKIIDHFGVSNINEKYLDDVKQNSDRKASMERIWNTDKLRFNGKGFVETNLFDSYQTTIFDERLNLDLEQEKNNLINTIERDNFIFATPYKIQPQDVVLVQTQNGFDSTVVETLPITEIEISNINYNNQIGFLIIFLSVPLVGLLFVNFKKNFKFKFVNYSFIICRFFSCFNFNNLLG